MQSYLEDLFKQVVAKQAKDSASYGVGLNQAMRAKHYSDVKDKYISGEWTEGDMRAYLAEPDAN